MSEQLRLATKEYLAQAKCLGIINETDRKRKACDCGFKKNTLTSSRKNLTIQDKRCSVDTPLINHITFPSYDLIKGIDETSDVYMDQVRREFKRHWALILEIDNIKIIPEIEGNTIRILSGLNQLGEKINVILNIKEGLMKTFKWLDLKNLNTLAVLYAQSIKIGGKHFVYVTDPGSVFIFKETLEVIQMEAWKLVNDARCLVNRDLQECFGCGQKYTPEYLSRCNKCKLAKYCSKECQTLSWNDSHKKLCSQSDVLVRFSAIGTHLFDDMFTFDLEEPCALPVYKPRKKLWSDS